MDSSGQTYCAALFGCFQVQWQGGGFDIGLGNQFAIVHQLLEGLGNITLEGFKGVGNDCTSIRKSFVLALNVIRGVITRICDTKELPRMSILLIAEGSS